MYTVHAGHVIYDRFIKSRHVDIVDYLSERICQNIKSSVRTSLDFRSQPSCLQQCFHIHVCIHRLSGRLCYYVSLMGPRHDDMETKQVHKPKKGTPGTRYTNRVKTPQIFLCCCFDPILNHLEVGIQTWENLSSQLWRPSPLGWLDLLNSLKVSMLQKGLWLVFLGKTWSRGWTCNNFTETTACSIEPNHLRLQAPPKFWQPMAHNLDECLSCP